MSFKEMVSLLPSSVFKRAYELYFIDLERMKIENLRIIKNCLNFFAYRREFERMKKVNLRIIKDSLK